ncbi:MAG: anti-toxin [Chloroflexota bacterium]|nr:anti-toxin [Chloroflexota bacterium]
MADTTITIPSGSTLYDNLERVASATGHSKKTLPFEELAEWLEDQADIISTKEVLARNEPTISIAPVRRELGLER